MNRKPINNNLTSRIIPGLASQYRIVSLPYWAWFWLDDFMRQNRVSYQGIYDTFGAGSDLNQTLHNIAELHQEHSMRNIYMLANDNNISPEIYQAKIGTAAKPKMKKIKDLALPKIYKLFGFMPCATTLEAVWKRRNYQRNNKTKR